MDGYYQERSLQLMERLDSECGCWIEALSASHGSRLAEETRSLLRTQFEAFLPCIPYIGGDENRRTLSILDAARCLVFYQILKDRLSAQEIGRVLFVAVTRSRTSRCAPSEPDPQYTPAEVTAYRVRQALRSRERRFPGDYVYEYVEPRAGQFEFGYDFRECGAQKLFREHGATEFLPYYCYLDFPKMISTGQRLTRRRALSLGDAVCDHRFVAGEQGPVPWPPPFADVGRK